MIQVSKVLDILTHLHLFATVIIFHMILIRTFCRIIQFLFSYWSYIGYNVLLFHVLLMFS